MSAYLRFGLRTLDGPLVLITTKSENHFTVNDVGRRGQKGGLLTTPS
jgi:hypothetical protein